MNDLPTLVAPLSDLTAMVLRPATPIEKVAPAPIEKARPTRKPRKVEDLSRSDVRVLYRARMAAEFGKRIFSFEENVEFTAGLNTSWQQWARLKRLGYVTDRGGPKLTPKGVAKLKELGK